VKRIWAVGLLLGARGVLAQSNPEDVVRAFFNAEKAGRWRDAAAMLDQTYITTYQQDLLTGLRNRPSLRKATVEDLMRADSTMPRAAAEYQLKQMYDSMNESTFLEQDFARVTTVDSLAALSPAEAAARWLEARDPAYKTELSYTRRHTKVDCPELSDSAKRAMVAKSSHHTHAKILGSTGSQDSVSYVVIGVDSDLPTIRPRKSVMDMSLRTITVHKVSSAWRIVPTLDMPDAYGLGGLFISAIECGRGEIFGQPATRN
jgi:hypothetical protein